ncbi:MAG: hypothetical protein AVDCRST_MAG12-2861, partial [uncultured Rubrobacteraceae bacterium]
EPHARVHASPDGLRARVLLLDPRLQRSRRRRARGGVRGTSGGRRRAHEGGGRLSGGRGDPGPLPRWPAGPYAAYALDRTPTRPPPRPGQVLSPHLPLVHPEARGRRLRSPRHVGYLAPRTARSRRGRHPDPGGV